MTTPLPAPDSEWLETDGLGGFASGTVAGPRTRRYHALLLTARKPPTERVALVNGFDAWVETAAGTYALSSQRYAPGVTHPDGATRLTEFTREPWPRWMFTLPDGTRVAQEIFIPHSHAAVVVTWRMLDDAGRGRLRVRPFLSGRDYHALHRENPVFRFDAPCAEETVTWQPYPGLPAIRSRSNAEYRHEPRWYRQFEYSEERHRGLDYLEDLASPGELRWELGQDEAVWILSAEPDFAPPAGVDVLGWLLELREMEARRRRQFPSALHRAADQYLVRRSRPPASGSASPSAAEGSVTGSQTLIAGYPWFTDWGRDTFLAMRGLCLATDRLSEAREILLAWADAISEGMLPNRFPDQGDHPEFNSVDASLWFVIASHEWLTAPRPRGMGVAAGDRARLDLTIEKILEGYSGGTRHGIRRDADGLLACGEPGDQLTWMDAKVGDWVITPRLGKPVEVQALWINALWVGSQRASRWGALLTQARASFTERFWNAERLCLFDVVDSDHVAGRKDERLRPNQILALGGLPLQLVEGERARLLLEVVEDQLLTPLGLRSLAPGEAGYAPRYQGGVAERDRAYHNGTVWPWLIGAFAEAWIRVHGNTQRHRQIARERFVGPLLRHLDGAGLGHVSEIADGEAPHAPRGCPWQAWSLGELLRLELRVLAEPDRNRRPQRRVRSPRALNYLAS